jgi:actin-related protein
MHLDLAGDELTSYLTQLLDASGFSLNSPRERDVVRDIKEKLCYVALDFDAAVGSTTTLEQTYELPCRTIITVSSECYRCPEALFQPSFVGRESGGIHECLFQSIVKCDMNKTTQEALYANIVLSGGSTMFPGIARRLAKELAALAPPLMEIQIVEPSDRECSAWIGGSILACASNSKPWITKSQYDESGPTVAHRQ